MALFGRETEADRARADSWANWARQQNVLAIVSLVLGVFSLIEFGALVIFGIGGIATGAMALRQLRREPRLATAVPGERGSVRATTHARSIGYADDGLPPPVRALDYERDEQALPRTQGRGLAWTGIITSIISLIIAAALYRGRFS
jgi:hypothetical protein